MKAWLVRRKYECEATIIFAETRGKAKATALLIDAFSEDNFVDLEAIRMSYMDKYYKEGKTEMDWEDEQDRIALVKDASFICNVDYRDEVKCGECSAKEFCDYYQDRQQ